MKTVLDIRWKTELWDSAVNQVVPTHFVYMSSLCHYSSIDCGSTLSLIGASLHSPFFDLHIKYRGHYFRLQWFSWRHFIFCLFWVSIDLSCVLTNDMFSFLLPFNARQWNPVIGKYSLRHDTGTARASLALCYLAVVCVSHWVFLVYSRFFCPPLDSSARHSEQEILGGLLHHWHVLLSRSQHTQHFLLCWNHSDCYQVSLDGHKDII